MSMSERGNVDGLSFISPVRENPSLVDHVQDLVVATGDVAKSESAGSQRGQIGVSGQLTDWSNE